MSIKGAIATLDTMIDLFEQMGAGQALDLQIKEISRRIYLMQREVVWTDHHALMANRLRTQATYYAMRYDPDNGCLQRRTQNECRLNDVRTTFVGLRQHLLREAERMREYDSATARWVA